jgi:hypothetical protein
VVCARLLKEFADLNAATGRDGGIVSVKAEVSDGQRRRRQQDRRAFKARWTKRAPASTPIPRILLTIASQGIAPAFGAGSFAKNLPTIFEPSAASQLGPA